MVAKNITKILDVHIIFNNLVVLIIYVCYLGFSVWLADSH